MNLSHEWVPLLAEQGWDACRWNSIGRADDPDENLIAWASEPRWVVLTQDLDFSRILFSTQAAWPSVVLLRVKDEFNVEIRRQVCATLHELAPQLESGALVIWTPLRARLRHLPIAPEG